jgi:hypothetical protein
MGFRAIDDDDDNNDKDKGKIVPVLRRGGVQV